MPWETTSAVSQLGFRAQHEANVLVHAVARPPCGQPRQRGYTEQDENLMINFDEL